MVVLSKQRSVTMWGPHHLDNTDPFLQGCLMSVRHALASRFTSRLCLPARRPSRELRRSMHLSGSATPKCQLHVVTWASSYLILVHLQLLVSGPVHTRLHRGVAYAPSGSSHRRAEVRDQVWPPDLAGCASSVPCVAQIHL